jgi:hypothetical protein
MIEIKILTYILSFKVREILWHYNKYIVIRQTLHHMSLYSEILI